MMANIIFPCSKVSCNGIVCVELMEIAISSNIKGEDYKAFFLKDPKEYPLKIIGFCSSSGHKNIINVDRKDETLKFSMHCPK